MRRVVLVDSIGVLMIGFTGGIGSGKSTVAAMLAERGAVVVDADAIAREVVEPGMPALAKLVDRFGPEILRPDGSLDRPALAARAFVTDEEKKRLEAITHPAIGEEFFGQIAAAARRDRRARRAAARRRPRRRLRRVIVVEAPRELRLDRLEARGVDRGDAERRIALQATDEDAAQSRRGWSTTRGSSTPSPTRSTTSGPTFRSVWTRRRGVRRPRGGSSPRGSRREAGLRRAPSPTNRGSPHRYDRLVPDFELVTDIEPAGDQPEAIAGLVEGVSGATGSRRCSASPARARASRSPT